MITISPIFIKEHTKSYESVSKFLLYSFTNAMVPPCYLLPQIYIHENRNKRFICIVSSLRVVLLAMQLAMRVSCLCVSNGEVFPGYDTLLQVG